MAEKNSVAVVGSIAYDHVMQYHGSFEDVMVPGNYNLALNAAGRSVYFGGCGGNISYNLCLFGIHTILVSVAGRDFGSYGERMAKNGCDISHIFTSDKHLTASAYIITDKNENQITIFDPGAMSAVETTQSLKDLPVDDIAWMIISPDNPERMKKFALECVEANIPFIFDPGQQIDMFHSDDLLKMIKSASVVITNEYEMDLLHKKLGLSADDLAGTAQALIETLGAKGSRVKTKEGETFVRAVQPSKVADPTGCGDAFRAGVLTGLKRGLPLSTACQIGSLMATYALETPGTQTHTFSLEEFAVRFENNFGERPF